MMRNLALVPLFLALLSGCAETTNGREPASPPVGLTGAISGDPPSAAVKHEARMPVVRDYEPHAIRLHTHEFVVCAQCR